MRMLRNLVPLALFVVLAVLLYRGLSLDPKKVPSPLVGKPVPEFALSALSDPGRIVSDEDLKGQVSILNVWATWCVSCRAEHRVLMHLANTVDARIIGLNYKDTRPDALRWLSQLGNPYDVNAFDEDGRVGIDWGVYGTPETFIIDRKGIIRYKHIGPVGVADLDTVFYPLIKALEDEAQAESPQLSSLSPVE